MQGIENARRVGERDYRLDSVEVHGNGAAAAFSWTSADGERVRWAQALALRDGRIIRMQDFGDPEKALRAIRR